MQIIAKFENGAEIEVPMCPLGAPAVFSMTPSEGCTFWFAHMDDLPSGNLLYKEVSAEHGRQILDDLLS